MKRLLCSLLVATLPFGSVLAEAQESKNAKVTLVYQHELPNVIKGVFVEYGPGVLLAWSCRHQRHRRAPDSGGILTEGRSNERASTRVRNFPQSITPAQWSRTMADSEQDRANLQQLNRNFVRSVEEADVAWFDANLAADFLNTNPDGSLIDRKAFLAQIGRGSTVKNIREHDVMIRILGDFAIIHARTTDRNPDETRGAGRYTDDWQFRDGRWQCVAAQFTRA